MTPPPPAADNHLGTLYASYEANVVSASAGPAQKIETRRAFFAGAQAIYGLMMNNVSDTPDVMEVTDQDLELMESLSRELAAFVAMVKAGKA